MTELVPYVAPKTTLEVMGDSWILASKIANTTFVPAALRGKPEAVLACILAGHEAGISPMQALAKIHIVDGRPGMAAELMRALVLRHGHELWYEESSSSLCTAIGKRRGQTRETRVTWTIEDAKRAALSEKDNWRKYPGDMLIARATGRLCRMIFSDVLAGISYTMEELLDMNPGDPVDLGDAIHYGPGEAPPIAPTARPTTRAQRTATRGAPAAKPDDPAPVPRAASPVPALPGEEDIEDAEIVDPPPPVDPEVAGAAEPAPPRDAPTASAPSAPAPATPVDPFRDPTEADWPNPEEAPGPGQKTYSGPQLIAIKMNAKEIRDREIRLELCSLWTGREIKSGNDLTTDEIQTVGKMLDDLSIEDARELVADLVARRTPAEPVQPPLEPPAPATPPPPPPAKPPAVSPEAWNADAWRTFIRTRKVKVGELIKEAQRLGASVATLDDIAGSGKAADLVEFCEETASERK